MLLSQVATSLKEMKRASVKDLASHLAIEPNALQGMMMLLEGKGRARRILSKSACGSCNKCDPMSNEIYEWVMQ